MQNVIYVYDDYELDGAIDEVLDGFDDDYCYEISDTKYAKIVHSDMTGMNIAFISDNRSEVEDITDDDIVDFIEQSQFDDEYMDWEDYFGVPVIDDEEGPLIHMNKAIAFPLPLSELVERYGLSDPSEVLDYVLDVYHDFWCVNDDFPDGSFKLDVVKYSHFRF